MRDQHDDPEERPPFGGSWNRIYGAVILFTILMTAVLYWMTVALNR